MNTLEDRLAEELGRQADELPDHSGDLERVQRIGGRRVHVQRMASIAGVAAVTIGIVATAVILNPGINRADNVTPGARTVFEDAYALTPYETATLLVECLADHGLDVAQAGDSIEFDDRAVAPEEFETETAACQAELSGAGFLLPGDNPDDLRILYAQFQALAHCYEGAGIEISDPPLLDEFIDARQQGAPAWSPQTEARHQVGSEAVTEAERTCSIPTPEQLLSGE